MSKYLTLALATAVIASLVASSTFGQEKNIPPADKFGWDLSYKKLLEKNKVGPDGWLAEWLKGTDRSATRKFLGRWKGEAIVASVMLEFPAFHAGEHSIICLIRTEKKAHVWNSHVKQNWNPEEKEIQPKLFDAAFKTISSWEQAKPTPHKSSNAEESRAWSGYFGFLNQFDAKRSRQILLVPADFFADGPTQSEPGRLLKVLKQCMNGRLP